MNTQVASIEYTQGFQRIQKTSCHAHRGENVGAVCDVSGIDVGDFVYSAERDIVGVVRGKNVKLGTVDVYLGSGILRFYAVGTMLVRPNWNSQKLTYAWEHVVVLRDE